MAALQLCPAQASRLGTSARRRAHGRRGCGLLGASVCSGTGGPGGVRTALSIFHWLKNSAVTCVTQKACDRQVTRSLRMDAAHLWAAGSGETAAGRGQAAGRGRRRELSSAARGSAAPDTPWPGRGTVTHLHQCSVLRWDKMYYNTALCAYYLKAYAFLIRVV